MGRGESLSDFFFNEKYVFLLLDKLSNFQQNNRNVNVTIEIIYLFA